MTKLYRTIFAALVALLFAPAAHAEQHYEETLAYAPVEGGQIEYVVSGPEDGETIVFVHGGGLADSFLPIMQEPALADFRKVRIHRMNFMGSFGAEAQTDAAAQAGHIIAVLDHLGARSAHLVSHSAGGWSVLELAYLHPERTSSLVLAESNGFPWPLLLANGMNPADVPAPPSFDQIAALGEAGDRAGAAEMFFRSIFGDDWMDFFDAVPGGWQQTLSDYGREEEFNRPGPEVTIAPEEIAHPSLVLWGSDNAWFSGMAQAAVSILPNAHGVEISDTDHALIVQKPAEIAQLIAEFVTENE